jgi:hypothetical protein
VTRSFWTKTIAIALGVFAVIVAVNWRYYFATPQLETGDYASYALQIHRAKHGAELYGNYSRYFFYHPGPGFFYVYASSERLLRDWLGLVPSAFNAHALAGLLLQSLFFGAALAIFAEYFRAPLFLPIALLLGAVHFGRAGDTFTSIWPPNVLSMPFLCFFTSVAAMAGGAGAFLPLVVLCGSFLVHGHVAQPLFVVPLFVSGYLSLRRSTQGGAPWRAFPAAHAAAAAILALFLLPLVIDWLGWPNDNLALIIHTLRGNSADHKSLWKSAIFLLTYFSYPLSGSIELLPWHDPGNAQVLADHPLRYLAWGAVFCFLAWRWRALAPAGDSPSARFARDAARFWLAAIGLCLVWGIIQSGPMWEFNAHFYYALLYVPLVFAAAALAAWIPRRGAPIAALVLVAGAAACGARFFRVKIPTGDATGMPLLAATQAALRADPLPAAAKILVFDHDDWGIATSVALVLDRSGLNYFVDPHRDAHEVMFGRSHALRPPYLGSDPPRSVWRFLRHADPGTGVAFVQGLRIAFAPGQLDPGRGEIAFVDGGNFEQYELAGCTTPESGDGNFTSTTLPEVEFDAIGSRAEHDVMVRLEARPYLDPPKIKAQPMELWINGAKVGDATLDHENVRATGAKLRFYAWQSVVFRVPAAQWNLSSLVRMVLKFPNARSPEQLGINADPRILGWKIQKISFGYAP